MSNEFVPTVGNVILRDREADQIVLKAKTLIDSAIAQSVSNSEISGGEFSKLLYDYNYGKRLTSTLTDARWDDSYLALNSGSMIENGAKDVYVYEEKVTLDGSGKGELLSDPVGNIYVQKREGKFVETVVPNGKDFTIPQLANEIVYVTYRRSETLDYLVIDADKFPKTYEMTIHVKKFDKTGHSGTIEWIFEQYQPSGNFEVALASETPSTSSMEGKILSNEEGKYGEVRFIPSANTKVEFTQIAASPSEVQLDSSVTGDSEKLTVIGIRGGTFSNVLLDNEKLTFSSDDDTVATVNTSGIIELAGGATAGDSTIIRITDGSYNEVVHVDVI